MTGTEIILKGVNMWPCGFKVDSMNFTTGWPSLSLAMVFFELLMIFCSFSVVLGGIMDSQQDGRPQYKYGGDAVKEALAQFGIGLLLNVGIEAQVLERDGDALDDHTDQVIYQDFRGRPYTFHYAEWVDEECFASEDEKVKHREKVEKLSTQ